jgi:hypothetical protein
MGLSAGSDRPPPHHGEDLRDDGRCRAHAGGADQHVATRPERPSSIRPHCHVSPRLGKRHAHRRRAKRMPLGVEP